MEALSTELDQIDDTRIHQHPLALRIKASDAMKLYSQRTLWKNLPSDQGLELQELLTAHHDAQCTDVRDRVFGLLSLAFFPDYTLSIQADYSLSVREVYTQTLNYCSDRYFYSAHQWLNASQLRKHAIQLQQVFKLDHLDSLVEEELIKILAPREVLDATFEASPPTPKPTMALRNYRWWIPSDGIRREVIQADIQQYLGVDALVKPGISTGDNAVCIFNPILNNRRLANSCPGRTRLLDI